jgi:hypothetical protein
VRPFLLALVVALLATTSFFGPPTPAVLADYADLLPTEAELNTTLAPFTISSYKAGPGKDGWDGNAEFDIGGSPEGQLHSSVDASELPTPEGAAGFLQTKLQQLRDDTRKLGFVGDLGPATDQLTMDADEAYWGVFMSAPGAPTAMVAAVHISRYEEQVIATTVMLVPSGPVTESTAQTLGVITGQMIRLMNSD